ncbi:hypothetical protein [Ottowia caeni]|uniref:hypothetical protein n=1 Tax=Ottowia caeni TaxID=2870339 RepID=UPI001E41D087
MTTKHCACCGIPFVPRPQVPDQAFCSAPVCQRARKRQWQQSKLQSDPDYRINQRAAQQAWSQRHQDYWRNYRGDRPEYEQRNREQQRLRDARESDIDLAKMLPDFDVHEQWIRKPQADAPLWAFFVAGDGGYMRPPNKKSCYCLNSMVSNACRGLFGGAAWQENGRGILWLAASMNEARKSSC